MNRYLVLLAIFVYLQVDAADLSPQNYHKTVSAWLTAAEIGDVETVKKLYNKLTFFARDRYGRTALHIAVENGDSTTVACLLGLKDIDVNICDKDGQTALHCAAAKNSTHIAKLLMAANGINLNAKDALGRTPIMLAIYLQAAQVFKLLLNKPGVSLDIINKYGQNLKEVALIQKCAEIILLLTKPDKIDKERADKTEGTSDLEEFKESSAEAKPIPAEA